MDKKLLSVIFEVIPSSQHEDILIEILSEYQDINLFNQFMKYCDISDDKLWALIFFGGADLNFIKGIIDNLENEVYLNLTLKWITHQESEHLAFYCNGLCIADDSGPDALPRIMRIIEYALPFIVNSDIIDNDKKFRDYLYSHLKHTPELGILSKLI